VKALAGLSVIFALLSLIFCTIGWDARTAAPMQVGTVFAGLWMMSVAVVLHSLLSK